MSEHLKSPIKDKPLRHAGQSLEEERRKLFADKLEPWLLMAIFFVVIAGLEWWRDFHGMKPEPGVVSAFALLAVAFAGLRFRAIRKKMRDLKQGAEGEKAVGQYLERLRAKGYEVFHDIVGPGFNVDHVLVGPAGVFTVETKTWSKPPRGDSRISFDGECLVAGNRSPDRDPIIQARAQAGWLKNLIAESTGRKLEIKPIVLFPGWFVEQSIGSLQEIWVLEPKALPAFLEREAKRLEPSESALVAFHLSRFIRGSERERERAS